MANRISKWFSNRRHEETTTLDDVQPLHPNEYPAKHLKEILDGRRDESEDRRSQPTGMPDGPGLGG